MSGNPTESSAHLKHQTARQKRNDLRQDKLVLRRAQPAASHAHACTAIRSFLQEHISQLPVGTLSLYIPIQAEPDPLPLAPSLLALGWKLCLPVIRQKHAAMHFRAWTPEMVMEIGAYDIPVPSINTLLTPTVVLLPLVAFDAQGYRLGYGGGYFDRTLAELTPRPLCIGLGFDICQTESILAEPHDIPLDVIITESGCHFYPYRQDLSEFP